MNNDSSLTHSRWECKLCEAEHNLQYVLSVIMWS